MKELKSCPFCGGKVELVENVTGWGNYTPPMGLDSTWWFRCTECYCMFNFSYKQNTDRTKIEQIEYLSKLFNTRKPIDVIVKQLEITRKEITKWDSDMHYIYKDGVDWMGEKAIEIVKGVNNEKN